MSQALAKPVDSYPQRLGAVAFPWLLSSTFHSLVLVLFAIVWPWSAERAPPAAGISLEVSMFSSATTTSSPAAVRIDAPPVEGYYDDDPVEPTARPSAGASGGSAALSTLLNEKPAVSLAGVLPASGAELGAAGATAGIGSAHERTGQPPPPNRVRGGMARTGVFGIQGEGRKFVYVFDRSGSMDGHGGAPMIAAKSELVASLDNLGQTHQFQIIFYNEEPRIFNPAGRAGRLVFGTDQNKNLARRFVGSITASGATRHQEALVMALGLGPDVIFFLTDADEPRMSAADLARIAQMNKGTSINAIEFGYGPRQESDNFLVALARQNGGQHVYIDVSQLTAGRR